MWISVRLRNSWGHNLRGPLTLAGVTSRNPKRFAQGILHNSLLARKKTLPGFIPPGGVLQKVFTFVLGSKDLLTK